MDGRIRNPNTRITKPAISRNGSLQHLGLRGKESSGSTVYATCDRSTADVCSRSASAKLRDFRYHDPTRPFSTDLPMTGYTVDTVFDFSATRAPEPQPPQAGDTQNSAPHHQQLACLYEHVQDGSHPQIVEKWSDEDTQTDAGDESAVQLSNELSQSLPYPPKNTSSGSESGDCEHGVTKAATQVVNDTDEFDEQIDDATLISVESTSNTPISEKLPLSSISESGTGSPAAVRQRYHARLQESSLKADKNEDEFDENPATFLHDSIAMPQADAASYSGYPYSSISAPLDENGLQCSASPSNSTPAGTVSCESPPRPVKGRGNIPIEAAAIQQNASYSFTRTSFNPLPREEKHTVPTGTPTHAVATSTETNVAKKPSIPQVNLGDSIPTPPTPPSTPVQDAVKKEPSTYRHLPHGSEPKPFLRPPFPTAVSNRSPVQGLTSINTLLRTCFRIGEALNASLSPDPASLQSPKNPPNSCRPQAKGTALSSSATILIELYAFVEHSYRSNNTQFFRFADLFFPSRPPYLCGAWQGWNNNPVFDADGRRFLGRGGREWKYTDVVAGHKRRRKDSGCADAESRPNDCGLDRFAGGRKICRVVGTIDKHARYDGQDIFAETGFGTSPAPSVAGVTMTVLSIWEAQWSDVDYVKGIVEA